MIVAIVGLVAALAYQTMRKSRQPHPKATNAASLLDIVKERYARGDINQGDYERMKQHLS